MCHCFSQRTPAALVEAKLTKDCNATHTNRGMRERDKVFIKAKKTHLENFLLWLSTIIYSVHFEMPCVQWVSYMKEVKEFEINQNWCLPRNQSKSLVPPRFSFDYLLYARLLTRNTTTFACSRTQPMVMFSSKVNSCGQVKNSM